MKTRLGNAGDFQAVLPMMRQHRLRQREFDPALYALHPDAEERFRHWAARMADDPRATLVVAEEDGHLIGYVLATIECDPPIYVSNEFAIVREWWVEPAFRGRGVGKALIDHAAADLAKSGLNQLRVRTAAADEATRAILQRSGFRPGTNEMVMELRRAK
jgi:GNAT superfamily N-acetyltransferase